uniref:BSD domain-containing protein n=1 Tax=Globisporangium ultimum (strain ATCC 200006 / CBS 805.95 / DAOM BR144) TaxID=431595 RepID=K3X0T7_GLOUD
MATDEQAATLRNSSSSKAFAAFANLATQARGSLSSVVLQRPKFLALESLQRRTETKTSISSSTNDETSDEIEERPSAADEATLSQRFRLESSDESSLRPRRSRLQSDDFPIVLPWELRDETGEILESAVVKEKILALSVYRRTFVEDAEGEDDYTFQYAKYKDVAKRLLHSDPNLREKYTSIVESPTFVMTEENFWRNFFLRCNAIVVEEGLPSYLPEVVLSSTAAVASFQKFKRDVFMKKKRSSSESWERLRRNLLQPRRPSDSSDARVRAQSIEVELGELDLDLDGEIERELIKRRPSHAMEYHRKAPSGADQAP